MINLLTHKDLVKVLAKKHKSGQNNSSKKIIIESYIECNKCGEKLTESIRLKKVNMEYSFLRFL
jgi:ribosomal protein L44E